MLFQKYLEVEVNYNAVNCVCARSFLLHTGQYTRYFFKAGYQAKAIVIVGISKTKAELIIVINKIKIKPDVAHFLFFDYIFDKKSRIDF